MREPENKSTADALAVLALALQCALLAAVAAGFFPGWLALGVAIVVFALLAPVALAIFHAKEERVSLAQWGWLALLSPLAGAGSFGVDWLIAVSNGQPNPLHFGGSLAGLPLTILICPVGTMVFIAGFVRGLWMKRSETR